MQSENDDKRKEKLSASFVTGAIALAFLIVGYQTALFIHKAASLKILADASSPDTVFVAVPGMPQYEAVVPEKSFSRQLSSRDIKGKDVKTYADTKVRDSDIGQTARERRDEVVEAFVPRQYECFEFDPNTVSTDDLCRLGFSVRQARAIDNYRRKGGRFHTKTDFSKSFVVADSVYRRLEPYIRIPRVDINKADSAMLDNLPGIGGYFASKIVSYRGKLGGFSDIRQLLEIRNFGEERLEKISPLIEIGDPPEPYALWTLPSDSLARHPHIRNFRVAEAIVLYRKHNPREKWTIDDLRQAGVIDEYAASCLKLCSIALP